ncbi:MAG TPA: hypothetical protein VFV33_27030 [Gemmatimonadaceae bacterium]|nr:hypothetical protein [Gemmatimonadaceae bacterium]
MTTTPRTPGTLNAVPQQQARIHRATQSVHPLMLALASNAALLDLPAAQGAVPWTDTGGVYSVSYVRNPGARYLRFELRLSAVGLSAGSTVQIKLDIRDALGASITSTDDRVPRGFKDEVQVCPEGLLVEPLFGLSLPVVGYLDLDSCATTLTDESWSLDFTVAVSGGGMIDGITVWELPRFVVDDSVTHGGVIPGSFQRDAVIHDGDVVGLTRLVATQDSARQVQRSYVSLTWRQQTADTTETPSTTATVDGPITLLDVGASRADYGVSPRSILAASGAGETARYRVLYKTTGGAGTETATVKLHGSATGSAWSIVLAYSASWVWSDWTACAVRTSPLSDALSLSASLSGAGPTFWVAGVHVLEDVT